MTGALPDVPSEIGLVDILESQVSADAAGETWGTQMED
jgi:hypothetical protein